MESQTNTNNSNFTANLSVTGLLFIYFFKNSKQNFINKI